MKGPNGFFRSFFLSNRFYLSLGAVIILFVTAFFIPVFFHVASTALVVCAALLLLDVALLYISRRAISAERKIQDPLIQMILTQRFD